jgi:hypothetical protein
LSDYKNHHYVPEWYQYRFFDGTEKEKKLNYLDMKPKVETAQNGKKYTRKSLLKWGPPSCFCQDDLYTTRFKGVESREIETAFFGEIDSKGSKAVDYFSSFEHPSVDPKAFKDLLPYISVQKLRTPKGLKNLSSMTDEKGKNRLLFAMQELHQMHCAIWSEAVWNIVDASQSETKFIISDHPVTVYNQSAFPESKYCKNSRDPAIWFDGTYTIFPLSLNKVLILTNLSWLRNPYGSPLKERPHSELFRNSYFDFTNIQTNRMLSEEEVITINHIIKSRAYRYIAAQKKEWLYPEKYLNIKRWDNIGSSYLLMPDPRAMSFSSEVVFGYDDRRADAFDEYGRKPWQADYREKNRHDIEWNSFNAFKGEFARKFGPKRRGASLDIGHKLKIEDTEGQHTYHLSLEQEFKTKLKDKK